MLRMRVVRVPRFWVFGRGTSAHVFRWIECRSARSVVSGCVQVVIVSRSRSIEGEMRPCQQERCSYVCADVSINRRKQ
jgi:hypothetical protein